MTVQAVGFSGPTYVQTPGNGSSTSFSFPFLVTAATDLLVAFITSAGYALQNASAYAVSGIGNPGGGQVTFNVPPPTGTTVDLRSYIPQTQPTNFSNLGGYYPESTTNAVDRVTRNIADMYRLTYLFGIHGPDQEGTPWPALPPAAQRLGLSLVCDPVFGLPTVGAPTTTIVTTALIAAFLDRAPTLVETSLGIVPSMAYAVGTSQRYGVVGDGVADDTAALNNWIKVVIASQITGTLQAGTFLVSSQIQINITGLGFKLLGPSASSCIFVAAASFTGATSVIQIKGNGNPSQWEIGGLSIYASAGGSGTAVIGLLVGDPTTAAINIFGYNFSTIQDVFVTNFATLIQTTHARMIRWVDCAGWDTSGTANICLLISQNGSGTSDQIFDKCQFVATDAGSNIAVSINSPVGPYNNSNGNCQIGGIKFRACDFYAGVNAVSITAAAVSLISDIWFVDGCEIDQQTATAIQLTSLNAGTVIQDVHIKDMYVNKTTVSGIALASTGSGGTIEQIWIEGNWIDQAQANAISVFGGNCFDIHVNNNEIVDCANSSGRAIEFNACTRVTCNFNRASTGLSNVKPLWLVGFDSGCTDIVAIGNDGINGTTSATIIDQSGAIANKTIVNNPGFNPIGSNAISVTGSPFTWTNNTGAAVAVMVTGGTVSSITVETQATGLTAGQFIVPQGASIVVTYSAAPTMSYFGIN